MKIIIVGAGEVGRHLAISLSREAHSISVIESSEGLANDLAEQLDANVIHGSGTSVNTLLEAGVGECELFLALTSDNEINVMACSMAQKLDAKKVIARVHPSLQREEWLFDYRSHFGIDHIFSSERLSAIELAKFVRNPDSLTVEEIARGRIELQQINVHEKSETVGVSLKDIKVPDRTRVAAITRMGVHFVPTADDVLQVGDLVTIFGEPRRLIKLAERIQYTKSLHSDTRVVIFGGGEYGFSLAQMLESWGCRVRIFEKNPEIAQSLTDRLSNTTVINTDATLLAELEEERVGEVDFFVATTESDEDNVMTCLQAHNLGAKNCLTIIHRADYAQAISSSGRHFGILAAVSPKNATRRELERFITSDRFHVVRKLGQLEIIEASVNKASIVASKMVGEVQWPEGCVLVAKMRGMHGDVPKADDILEPGDTVYAMVTAKVRKDFLKLLK